MKYFDKDGKYNFIDKNNVFIGFDNTQDCRESFGWKITDNEDNIIIEIMDCSENCISLEDVNKELDGYNFKTDSFLLDNKVSNENTFSIVIKKGRKTRKLVLYNCHDGYYAHGFVMKNGEELIIEDLL